FSAVTLCHCPAFGRRSVFINCSGYPVGLWYQRKRRSKQAVDRKVFKRRRKPSNLRSLQSICFFYPCKGIGRNSLSISNKGFRGTVQPKSGGSRNASISS